VNDDRSLVTRVIAGQCVQRIVPVDAFEISQKAVNLLDQGSVTERATVGEVHNPGIENGQTRQSTRRSDRLLWETGGRTSVG
jgi:hypothetical protein